MCTSLSRKSSTRAEAEAKSLSLGHPLCCPLATVLQVSLTGEGTMTSHSSFESPTSPKQPPVRKWGQVTANQCLSVMKTTETSKGNITWNPQLGILQVVGLAACEILLPGAKRHVFSELSIFLIIREKTPSLIFSNYLPPRCPGSRLKEHRGLSIIHAEVGVFTTLVFNLEQVIGLSFRVLI